MLALAPLKQRRRVDMRKAILFGVVAALCAHGAAAPTVALTELPGWKDCGAQAVPVRGGYRIVQAARKGTYGWVELRTPLDLDRYPELLVEVAGASPEAKWLRVGLMVSAGGVDTYQTDFGFLRFRKITLEWQPHFDLKGEPYPKRVRVCARDPWGSATSEDSYRDLDLGAINETGSETGVRTKPVGR
jgi:hypothetical protein